MKKIKDILFIDKPKGMTSFDVIRHLRKKHGAHMKMGHAGTLDPAATGLLLVGIGEGTKQLKELLKLPKIYEVEILLGTQTDTGDMDGKIIATHPMTGRRTSCHWVRDVVEGIKGEVELPVPRYSAIKQKGVPLYKRARRGELFEPPIRKMEIKHIVLNDMIKENDSTVLKVIMEVGSGTYVRSIAEEIGKRLGVPATVKELRRTKIGEFDVRDAKNIDEIKLMLK